MGSSGISNILAGICSQFPPGDPNQNALLYWNDANNDFEFLGIGSGLSIVAGDLVSSGGGGTPAGPANSIQFNNGGAFGGSSDATFDPIAHAAAFRVNTFSIIGTTNYPDGMLYLDDTNGRFILGDSIGDVNGTNILVDDGNREIQLSTFFNTALTIDSSQNIICTAGGSGNLILNATSGNYNLSFKQSGVENWLLGPNNLVSTDFRFRNSGTGQYPLILGSSDNSVKTISNTLDNGSGAASFVSLTLNGDLTLSTHNIITDTTTGTKIGTSATQKLGLFGAAPVVQQLAATDLGVVLSNLGARAAGTAYLITTSGNVTLTGTTSVQGLTIVDNTDITLATANGTRIGTATNQKLGFFAASAIVQPVNTTDLGTVLSSLGLRAAGTAYPITTSGAVTFSGALNFSNTTMQTGSSAGLQIATGTTQKLGLYGATPVVQAVATTDLGVVLSNLGARAVGTAYPITTTGAVSSGAIVSSGSITASTNKIIVDGSGSLGSAGGLYFRNIGKDAGLVMEGTQVLSLANNVSQIGTRDTTIVGGIFRFDTRTGIGGTNGGEQAFIVFGSPTGGSAFNNVFAVSLQTGETLLCANSGNASVGLTGSATAKLDVNGAFRARGTASFDVDAKITTAGNTLFIKEGTNGMQGFATMVAGVATVSITGLLTTDHANVTLTTPGGTIGAGGYKAACTSGTLTITSINVAGVTNTLETSTYTYTITRAA